MQYPNLCPIIHDLELFSSSPTWSLYSISCAELMSSRAFCHYLRHSNVAGALSHHWYLVVGIHFLIMSVQQVFLVPYFFFTLQSYSASAFFASIFSSSLQRWPSHDNLLLFTILLPFSTPVLSCNYLFLKFFGHLTPMTSWSSSHWKESIISEMVLLVVHNYLLHWKMLLDISFGKIQLCFDGYCAQP